MTYKQWLSEGVNNPNRAHVERAKRILGDKTYRVTWQQAVNAFEEGLKANIPNHQLLNHAGREANLIWTRAMNRREFDK